jgi:hypothetical protein
VQRYFRDTGTVLQQDARETGAASSERSPCRQHTIRFSILGAGNQSKPSITPNNFVSGTRNPGRTSPPVNVCFSVKEGKTVSDQFKGKTVSDQFREKRCQISLGKTVSDQFIGKNGVRSVYA